MAHSPYKQIRKAKRSSINVPYTLSTNNERLFVYNSSNGLLTEPLVKKILKKCVDDNVQEYRENNRNDGGFLYECASLSFYNTEYKPGQFVILPNSSNISPKFGEIKKLLCSSKYGYLVYKKTTNVYCSSTDLFMVNVTSHEAIIPVHHLGEFHPLEGYEVGQSKKISISLRNHILEFE